MRIVHVNFVRPLGRPEPERVLRDWPTLGAVAEAVAVAGARVTVVQAFHRDAVLERTGVRYRFVAVPALPGRSSGLTPWRIARAVHAEGPDVIHVNGLDFPLQTRLLCRAGVPVLVQDHASRTGSRARRWGLARVAGASFTATEQAREFIVGAELPSSARIFGVPESSSHFGPGSQEKARAATRLWGDPAVLWVGRLDSNKDPLCVIDAVARAAPDMPGLTLWCCYHDAPLLDQVQRRIAQYPALVGRVRLIGQVDHARIETWMRAADVFMLASRREGSGYALIEAMACGLWPIVTDIPPFRAVTGGGAIGALVPVGDSAMMAWELRRFAGLLDRPALRRRVLAHFAAELSFARIGVRLKAAYAELAARAR